MVCHSSAKIRRRRSEAYRKINNYVLMSFCLKKENHVLMSSCLKKINTDRSVFIVEIFYDKRVQSRIYSSYAERSKKHARRK